MKLHKNLCEAVVHGLDQVFIQGMYAHQAVEQLLLSNKKWGARDRNFIADHMYSIIRYYRLYCAGAGISELHIPESDAWAVLGACLIAQAGELPAWPEWADIDREAVQQRLAGAQAIRRIRESIPDWLDETGERELGSGWDDELQALNLPAPLCIRINTLRATIDTVTEFLRSEDIDFELSAIAPHGIIIHSKKNLRNTYAYKSGWFEVQDISSQRVAQALAPQQGMTVIDACAGAGGKALQLAALMQDSGSIFAIDVYADKLKQLELRARRNGANNITTHVYSAGMEQQYRDQADRLLLDVPCSGTGIIRRHPDTKWKLTPEELERLIALQSDLLHRYSIMLKPGGMMVYATCSILPSENEKQVQNFLRKNASFKLIKEQKISPYRDGSDGFYIATLVKDN